MAQAEFHEVLAVDKDKLFSAVTKYEDYPSFVDGCRSVQVERKGPGKARVTYKVSMIKELTYTLDHEEDREKGIVRWTLVTSDLLKENRGAWEIKAAGAGKSDVKYSIEIDFKIPVPGFVLGGLVKKSLPSMVKSFEKQTRV